MEKIEILIIDDKPNNLQIITNYLNEAGYKSAVASSGNIGLERARRILPELILLDINMPGMNGFEVCQQLKADSATKDIPIIFITALSDTENIVQGFKVGGSDYIIKPFRKEELIIRVKNQLKIYRYQHDLEKEVELRTKSLKKSLTDIQLINQELKIAREKAEESDRLKTIFLANMSHEIRTPMNGIMGFAELLTDPKLEGNYRKRYIQLILQSGQRMLNIINDLVDISKIEAGQIDLNEEEVCLNNLMQEIYEFFAPEVEDKGVSLTLSNRLENKDCIGNTDKNKLTQIIHNLVKNAIKFTENGEIRIGYYLKEQINPNTSLIEFFVRDTGIGIPEDNLESIFDRFTQVAPNGNKIHEGAGLGLSITKAYVELLGGKISVKSDYGKGSEFTFSIALKHEQKPNSSIDTDKLTTNKQGMKPHILLAEDEDINALYLIEVIESAGMTVDHVKTGTDAVRKALEHDGYNIILMDIKMPGLDGLTATRKIKEIKPDLPIIVQTAYVQPKDREKAMEAGSDGFITKPTPKETIIEAIYSSLQSKIH